MTKERRLMFSKDEFITRLEKVRASMSQANIDILLISDPSNMNWLTGYDGWSFYVHQGVIISHDESPIWFGRHQDKNGALLRCYMDDEHIIGYPESYIQNPNAHPMEWIADHIFKEKGWDKKNIGCEFDNYYYSAKAHETLTTKLSQAKFVDSNGLVNWCRAVKSPKELSYMKIAGKIVEKMHQRVLDIAEVGLPKNQLVAEVYHTGITGHDEYGGDYPSIVPLLPSGVEASASHITWDDRPLKADESTFFELSGCYRRYHAPMSRTLFLGTPNKTILNAETALLKALDAGLSKARAGNKTKDIAIALNKVMADHGIDRGGARCGYPIGLSYPPDWGERTMSFRDTDETILEPGMTFHFMPGIWQSDWGLEITESIVITESGYETLANVPRKLFVK